jgi:cold shock protein
MLQGKIKWYNTEKGYGFILNDDGKEVFFHRSGIDQSSKHLLTDGASVTYEMTQGLKGPQATRVKVV